MEVPRVAVGFTVILKAGTAQITTALMLLCHICVLRTKTYFFDVTLPHMRITLTYLFL